MLSNNFISKFNKFIYLPDIGNKLLASRFDDVKGKVYLRYIFSTRQTFNAIAIKGILALQSIYPQRAKSISKLIILKFGKARCHSIIYIALKLNDALGFLTFFIRKPSNTLRCLSMYQASSKYFIFPGFISLLLFPSWNRSVQLSLDIHRSSSKYSYFFKKVAFFD